MTLGTVGSETGDERLDRAVARAIGDKHTPAERCVSCSNAVGSLDCRCVEEIEARVEVESQARRARLRVLRDAS